MLVYMHDHRAGGRMHGHGAITARSREHPETLLLSVDLCCDPLPHLTRTVGGRGNRVPYPARAAGSSLSAVDGLIVRRSRQVVHGGKLWGPAQAMAVCYGEWRTQGRRPTLLFWRGELCVCPFRVSRP
jgi:hypothetical protein